MRSLYPVAALCSPILLCAVSFAQAGAETEGEDVSVEAGSALGGFAGEGGLGGAAPAVEPSPIEPVEPIAEPPGLLYTFTAAPEGSEVFLGPPPGAKPEYDKGPWQRRLESEEYKSVCTAPCQAYLAPGSYGVALAPPGGDPLASSESIEATEPTEVTLRYENRKWLRTAGWLTAAVSLVGGGAMIAAGATSCDSGSTPGGCVHADPLVWTGAGLMLVGIPTGLWLTLQDDKVSFSTSPPE